jgi:hypothetical protein
MLREHFTFAISSKLFLQGGFVEGIRDERSLHEAIEALAFAKLPTMD